MRTNTLCASKTLRGAAALAALLAAPALLWLSGCAIESEGAIDREDYVVPSGPAPYLPPAPQAVTRKVIILHTNDEHSHLLGFGPESEYPFLPAADGKVGPAEVAAAIDKIVGEHPDQKTKGGIVRRQYLINKIRSHATDPVLLISGGDFTMGTIFHAATAQAAPDLLAMGLLGYDFATLGNHEFDWGPDVLSAELRAASNTLFGGMPAIISSNIHFDDVEDGGTGSDLKALYGPGDSGATVMPWATRRLANGLKVGVLGLTGYEAALVSAGLPPVSFSVPKDGPACGKGSACAAGLSCVQGHCVNPLDVEGHLAAAAADAQPVIDLLRNEEGVDLVIAITHLGVAEDYALAQMTSGIDVIIGGHSHTQQPPTVVPSQVGEGQTIIVQAGDYGTRLGQLAITVAPDGEVGYVEEETMLHEVDRSLDVEIFGDTDLTVTPPVLSVELERAMTLTGSVVGPVLGGLNARLQPTLGAALLDEVVFSDHDVVGEALYKDTNLMHLVVDALHTTVSFGACMDPDAEKIIAVQANGVIRESLRFNSHTGGTTVSDIFRVLPLGASPYEEQQPSPTSPCLDPSHPDVPKSCAAPGFPISVFRLSAAELFAGADVGVTKGLESDSFFLSYAGLRVRYDMSLPPVDPAKLREMATNPLVDPGGRIVSMELGTDATGWTVVYEYDKANPQPIWGLRWKNGVDPATTRFTIITNLYLAGFLNAFGIVPKDAAGAALGLDETVMCRVAELPVCDPVNPAPAIAPCRSLPGVAGDARWPYPEAKEWQALYMYLTMVLGGNIPNTAYTGDLPEQPRVIPVQ